MGAAVLVLLGGVVSWIGVLAAVQEIPLAPDRVAARLHESLAPLPALLKEDPTGNRAQIHLAKQRLTANAIMPYFYGVPGALHELSPARQARVEEIEQWLLPHEADLIQLIKASSPHGEVPNAAISLCYFARPTATLRDALLETARSPTSDWQKAGESYEALVLLQLDDAALRTEMVEVIGRGMDREMEDREQGLARMLLGRMAGWALPELGPIYRELLSVPYKPEYYPKFGGQTALLADYMVAARGLAAWGTLGAPYLDLLKARLAEMNPAAEDDKAIFIQRAKEAVEIVEGKRVPKLAVTWKGQILGVSKAAYAAWLERQAKPLPPAESSSAAMTATTQAQPAAQPPPQPSAVETIPVGLASWLVWLIIVLGGATLVWYLARRK